MDSIIKKLYEYLNGNVTVSIYDNGTKTQSWDGDSLDDAKPEFPNSIDIKITNFCDLNCPFCHEESSEEGKHGDLTNLFELLKNLPAGTELAIGGGNPLSHPFLCTFLLKCKHAGFIPNMTVNYHHIKQYSGKINYLLELGLVHGLGISVPDNFSPEIIELISKKDNIVLHLIAGVNKIDVLHTFGNSYKYLILGYKQFGRGITYSSEVVNSELNIWYRFLPLFLGKVHLSFDNLAIEQLRIKRLFSKNNWDKFFMGDDGKFTMYIDAVEKTYSKSSTSTISFSYDNNISKIFKNCI